MNKKIICLAVLSMFIVTPAIAEKPLSLRAKFRALSNSQDFIPPKQLKKLLRDKRSVNIRLRTFIPALGPVSFRLNKEKLRSSLPTITDENGIKDDTSGITLLSGRIKTKLQSSPLAGSIYHQDDIPYLFLSFKAKNPRYKKYRFYRLSIPLDNSDSATARLQKLNTNFNSEGCTKTLTPNSSVERSSSNTRATTSFNVISLNLEAEKSMFDIHGSNTNNIISTYVNESEVIYQNDLNLTYEVVRQNVNTTSNFGSSDAENKLINYQTFANSESFNRGDASMLFTGQNLNGATIGIAYVGAVCASPRDSYGLTQFTNSIVTPVTFAHELGHLLNAEHTSSGIMSASVSETPATSFSTISSNEINSFVSNVGGCLTNDDNGDNSATIDFGNQFLSLELATSLKRSTGVFTLSYSTPSISVASKSCNLQVRVSSNERKINRGRGRLLLSQALSNPSNTINATLETRARRIKRNGDKSIVYFRALLTCDDGSRGESRTTRVRAFRMQSRTSFKVARWIAELQEILN